MSVGGDDIIPFEKESDAKEFLEKQSGKKIFGIDRMNANFINYLEMR
jgi:nitrous oxide reductase accessory protein NosL